MKRLWPFPGEVPVVRARKVALAYRHLARQQHEIARALADALHKADTRLLAYDSPATLHAIKQALALLDDADPVADLDKRFTDWGETFHADAVTHYEMDDYVKAEEAAKIIHIGRKSINSLRIAGRIKGHWDPGVGSCGGYLYQVRDLYELSTTLRTRGWRAGGSTDNLQDDGRSDSK